MDLTPIKNHVIPFVKTLVPLLRSQSEKDARQARTSNSVAFLTSDGVAGGADRSVASLVKTAVKLGKGPMANALLEHAAAKALRRGEAFDKVLKDVHAHYVHKDVGNRVALGTFGGALVGSLIALGLFPPAAVAPLVVVGLAGVAALKTRHATERLVALEHLGVASNETTPQRVLYTGEENDPNKPRVLIEAQNLDDEGNAERWDEQPEEALKLYDQALDLLRDVPPVGTPWKTPLPNNNVARASDVWHTDVYNTIGLLKHHKAKAYAQLRAKAEKNAGKCALDSSVHRAYRREADAAHEQFTILEGEAVRDFRDLVRNHGDSLAPLTHTAALYNLACAESLLGDVEGARTHWNACLEKTLANLAAFPENDGIRDDAAGTLTALTDDDDLGNLKTRFEENRVPLEDPRLAAKLAALGSDSTS